MKKFFWAAIAAIITALALSATVFAAEHTHTWEMFSQGTNSFQVVCDDCGTFVSVPTETLVCEHEFVSGSTATGLCMTECTKCGYSVQGSHIWEHYALPEGHGVMCTVCLTTTVPTPHYWSDNGFEDDMHILKCMECGYEETHPSTHKVDENGHHDYCNVCEGCSSHTSHQFVPTPWDENFIALQCDCGYHILKSYENFEDEEEESYETTYGLVTDIFSNGIEVNGNSRYDIVVDFDCALYDYVEITINEYYEVVGLRVLVEGDEVTANTVADIISDDPLILIMEDGRSLHFEDYIVYDIVNTAIVDGGFIAPGDHILWFNDNGTNIIIDIWVIDFDLDNEVEIDDDGIGYGIITDFFSERDEDGERYDIAEILINGEYIEYKLDRSLDCWDYAEGSFIEFTIEDDIIVDIQVHVDADIVDDEENYEEYISLRVLNSYSMIEDLTFEDLIMDQIEFFRDELFIEFESGRLDWTVEFEYIVYDLREGEMGELREGDAILSFVEDEIMYIIIFW